MFNHAWSFWRWLPGNQVIWSFILMAPSTQVPLHKKMSLGADNSFHGLTGPIIWSSLCNLVIIWTQSSWFRSGTPVCGRPSGFVMICSVWTPHLKRTPNVLANLLPASYPAVIAVFGSLWRLWHSWWQQLKIASAQTHSFPHVQGKWWWPWCSKPFGSTCAERTTALNWLREDKCQNMPCNIV